MSISLNINKRTVPVVARNKRIYSNSGSGTIFSSSGGSGNGSVSGLDVVLSAGNSTINKIIFTTSDSGNTKQYSLGIDTSGNLQLSGNTVSAGVIANNKINIGTAENIDDEILRVAGKTNTNSLQLGRTTIFGGGGGTVPAGSILNIRNYADEFTLIRVANRQNESTISLTLTDAAGEDSQLVDFYNMNYAGDCRTGIRQFQLNNFYHEYKVGSGTQSALVIAAGATTTTVNDTSVTVNKLVANNNVWLHGITTTYSTLNSSDYAPASNFMGLGGVGYGITKDTSGYTLEVDNIKIRKSLIANELVLNKIRATNGSFWVTDSCKVKTGLVFDGDNWYFVPEDDVVFAVGDIIKSQCWSSGGYYTYTYKIFYIWHSTTDKHICVQNLNGTQPTAVDLTGKDFVRVGNASDSTRQGALYLTSSDANSPYLEILNGMTSDVISASNRKVRLGKLDGITMSDGTVLTGYGLYTNSAFLEGKILSNTGKIGGFNISSAGITSGTAGTPRINLDTVANAFTLYGAIDTYNVSITGGYNPLLQVMSPGFYGGYAASNIDLYNSAVTNRFTVTTAYSNLRVLTKNLESVGTANSRLSGTNWQYLRYDLNSGTVAYNGS